MKPSTLLCLFCCSLLASQLMAHGGRRIGPGSIAPPKGMSRAKEWVPTGKVPGPGTPTTPPPGAPAGGASTPAPNAGGGTGPKTPRGMQVGEDLGRWTYWWDVNQDDFLGLRDVIGTSGTRTGLGDIYMGPQRRREGSPGRRPTEKHLREELVPALERALSESAGNRDMTSACLIALAKIGSKRAGKDLLPAFRPHLTSKDQEIRETAALAMGIARATRGLDDLIALALDKPEGRKLVARPRVDYRTRAFAAYGLGLIAQANRTELPVQRRVFTALRDVLADRSSSDRNLPVAAISGMALLQLKKTVMNREDEALLQETLDTLRDYYKAALGKGARLLQCHALTTSAKLLGRGNDARQQQLKKLCLQALQAKRQDADVSRAATVALGCLALPAEKLAADKIYSETLHRYFQSGRDAQARAFCLVALGQIGGATNRVALLQALRKGKKALERPWAALALGVHATRLRRAGADLEPLQLVGSALLEQFQNLKTPSSRSAIALALGLCRYQDAGSTLAAALKKYEHQDQFAGFLCLGLALMDYRKSLPDMHDVVRGSVRRPMLLKQGAIALGLMGDKRVGPTLLSMLEGGDANLAKMGAVTSAIAFVGDRDSVAPLKALLFDSRLTALSRAFAAVALGGIAASGSERWNAALGRNINYRAAVETLSGSGTGVLDIL